MTSLSLKYFSYLGGWMGGCIFWNMKECEGMFEKECEIPFDGAESLCWMESSFIFFSNNAEWLFQYFFSELFFM
jgi:hypothetical protein